MTRFAVEITVDGETDAPMICLLDELLTSDLPGFGAEERDAVSAGLPITIDGGDGVIIRVSPMATSVAPSE